MKEVERLKSLRSYDILDTLPEKEFDEIVELASIIYDTPVAFISLLESKRQWFKSIKGLAISEAATKDSFCKYTIQNPKDVMVIPDATKDERFYTNPYVIGEPNMRFYAGTSLVTEDDVAIGTICVIDYKPREFDDEKKKWLKAIAKRIMNLIEIRKNNLLQKQELGQTKEDLNLAINRLIEAQKISHLGSWKWNIQENVINWSDEMYTIFQQNEDEEKSFTKKNWHRNVHQDDIKALRKTVTDILKNKTSDVVEFRLVKGNLEKWVEARGKVTLDGVGKVISVEGTVQDITERKKADSERKIYIETLHSMLFDLSHKVRIPITNSLGLIDALYYPDISKEQTDELMQYLNLSVKEIDTYIRRISDQVYENKKLINSN